MIARGYKPTMTECLEQQWKGKIGKEWWGDYVPTQEAITINQQRINDRLNKLK